MENALFFLHRYFFSWLVKNSLNNWLKPKSGAWKLVNGNLYAIGRWNKVAPCSSSWTEVRLCCSATPLSSWEKHSFTRMMVHSDWPDLSTVRLEYCISWAQLFCFWFQSEWDTFSCPWAEHRASNNSTKQNIVFKLLLWSPSPESACHSLL